MGMDPGDLVPKSNISRCIHVLRGQRVLLDRDLAALYAVKTIALRQQVKRNLERFPADFMFQLTAAEAKALVSQKVIPSGRSLGGHLPYAFTQEGISMLSSVLRSPGAVMVNVEIMRTFVRLREMTASHRELARRLDEMERRFEGRFRLVFRAIRRIIAPREPPKPQIGFRP